MAELVDAHDSKSCSVTQSVGSTPTFGTMNLAIFKTLGIVLFMYLTWRNLRDDYSEDDLVTYGWLSVLTLLVFGRLAFGLINWGVWNERWWDWLLFWEKPGSNVVFGYGGLLLITGWWSRVKGWKVWALLEDISPNLLVMFLLISIDEIVWSWRGWRDWGVVGILLLGLVAGRFLSQRYRSFVWYRSGKKGFVFWAVNAIIWLSWSVLTWDYLKLIVGLISVAGLVILGDVFTLLKVVTKRR